MTEACDRVSQGAVDRYIARYGPADIDRWKAAGELVIVDEKCGEQNVRSSKNRN